MPLTDTTIKNAKHGPKPIKLTDGRGMYLLLQPSGGKLWKMKYRIGDKEKKLSFGSYPDVSLKEARSKRDEARAKIANGVDPGAEKKAASIAAKLNAANTFRAVGDEYLEKAAKEGRADVTINKSRWLLGLMEASIGQRPIADITPAELLAALKRVESKGHLETARRMRSLAGRIFSYAIATSRAANNPALLLRGALTAPIVKHHAAILDPAEVGGLLRAIDAYTGHPLTRLALQLAPHVFARPGMVAGARWSEFDLDKGTWSLSSGRMKMRRPHVVPLSRQALEILRSAEVLSAGQEYVFSSLYGRGRPMSENTMNQALRRMGYSGDEMTAHGFRSTASTLLNESGKWSPDAIERALAHVDTTVRGIYHRGAHWDERLAMAQWWSDQLGVMRVGAEVVPINQASSGR